MHDFVFKYYSFRINFAQKLKTPILGLDSGVHSSNCPKGGIGLFNPAIWHSWAQQTGTSLEQSGTCGLAGMNHTYKIQESQTRDWAIDSSSEFVPIVI